MLPKQNDVLIVGTGPAGLALAVTLAQSGVKPLVIDRAATQQTTSRAAVIHAHTLEVLDKIGVAGPMLAEGMKLKKFAVRDRDRLLSTIRFDNLPSKHKYLLMLTQDRTEAILIQRLSALGVEIQRGARFTGMKEVGDRAVVQIEVDGQLQTVSASFVVGADGMHSAVREHCGIAFDGSQYAESFVLADVTLDSTALLDEVKLFLSPDGLVVVAPLPGGLCRIVATADAAPEKPDAAFIQTLLDARGPTKPLQFKVRDVGWSSRFRLHHRLAEHYRHGRAFIVGDAAHVHSPAGGQGMNTGLVDAYTLGALMSRVVKQQAQISTLDQYETMRRPAAQQVLAMAGRMTDAAIMRSPLKRMLRNFLLATITRLPAVRKKLSMALSGLARRSATVTE